MFPVFIKKKDEKPPEGIHYIIAKNGVFLKKENAWMKGVVPVKQIAVLEIETPYVELKVPPISRDVLARSWNFFQAVYKKYRAESAVLLHYSAAYGWQLTVPEQTVTPTHVDYKITDRIPGYELIGTMHSHADMSSFHSGTDTADEAVADGIHITFGNLGNENSFSIDPEIVVNGKRFKMDVVKMEGVVPLPTPPPVPEPEPSVIRRVVRFAFHKSQEAYYSIDRTFLGNWEVPDEWMAKVKSRIFSYDPGTSGKRLTWYSESLQRDYGDGMDPIRAEPPIIPQDQNADQPNSTPAPTINPNKES